MWWVLSFKLSCTYLQFKYIVVGQLVDINKWECDKQIGSITLHHASDGKPAIMVAQPGGTFMRIRCHSDGVAKIDG